MTTPEKLRRRQRIEGLLLIGIGLIMIVQQQYWQHQRDAQIGKDAKQDKVLAQAVKKNTELTECLAQLTVQINENTGDVRVASQERDAANREQWNALADVFNQRVLEHINESPWQTLRGQQFRYWHDRFNAEEIDLAQARKDNPPPEFSDFCPKVAGTDVTKAEEKANNAAKADK